jgi:hypothetical protein
MIIGALVLGFAVVRSLLIPESFGTYGHYRGDNLAEQMTMPLVHLESGFCTDCHQDQHKSWQESNHRTVNCEVCHGHWEIHNGNLKTMTAAKSNEACLLCHQALTGRPASVSQVKSFALHLAEKEETGTDVKTCVECHDPHAPLEKGA